jgi:hypothetical protein
MAAMSEPLKVVFNVGDEFAVSLPQPLLRDGKVIGQLTGRGEGVVTGEITDESFIQDFADSNAVVGGFSFSGSYIQ